MLKARFQVLGTIAFSALLFIGSSAFAAHRLPSGTDFFSPLKMPRYEQWRKLSPKAREKFIQDVQAFLLRADAIARSEKTASNSREAEIIQRLFDIWIETAEAQTKSKAKSKHAAAPQQPYCINQGVVKPLSECDTKLGYKMHDFDTNEKLSPLGDASKCQAPEKPCSPFFGFTTEGQMFCSSLNLTRDCKQKSEQEGTISLASTLATCEKGSPGTPKVDCGKLKTFFTDQLKAVGDLCQDAPKRFACGILKDQIQGVMSELKGEGPVASETAAPDANAAPSTASDADENGVPALASSIKDAAKMDNSAAPCPTEQGAKPSTAPASAQAPATEAKADAQNGDNSACVKKAYPQKIAAPALIMLVKSMVEGADDGFTCGEMALPNQGKLKVDMVKSTIQLQASANSAPVTLSGDAVDALSTASAALLGPPFNVAPANLLNAYLPKEELKDPGKIVYSAKDVKPTQEFPSSGWISQDGTRIRYAIAGNKAALLLAIKRPGDTKEALLVFAGKNNPERAPAQPAGAKDSRAASSQPK